MKICFKLRERTAGRPHPPDQGQTYRSIGIDPIRFIVELRQLHYIDRNLIFDMSAIKTMFPVQPSGLPQWIDKDAYGSGLTPIPYTHYVDDCSISLGRIP